MPSSAFSHKNFLNTNPSSPAKNACDVGPCIVFLAALINPLDSNFFISCKEVNVLPSLPTLDKPNVAKAIGSANICAAKSIAPVIKLYALVPGSITSSNGLNNQRPIVTVGATPAASNLALLSPWNCTPVSAFSLCSSYICGAKTLSKTNCLASVGLTPDSTRFLYSSVVVGSVLPKNKPSPKSPLPVIPALNNSVSEAAFASSGVIPCCLASKYLTFSGNPSSQAD